MKQKKAGKEIKAGFPKFKSKKHGRDSFRLNGAIQVEMENPAPLPLEKGVVGVDLGILRLATVSDGTGMDNPHALKGDLRKIQRLQRVVSRRQKGNANRKKAVRKLARAHLRVADVRKNALHQITSRLATLAPAASAGGTKSVVVLEDLNVSGMLKNHPLAQVVADVGFCDFRRQMEYKGRWCGSQIILSPRFYPSPKRCSAVGTSKRSWNYASECTPAVSAV